MVVLDFKGYSVTQMEYIKNTDYKRRPGIKRVDLSPKIRAKSTVEGDTATVELSVNVGAKTGDNLPFYVSCTVRGIFKYNVEDDENGFGIQTLLRNNSVAILYPYVRAIVGNLTASSNEFPGYYMPTINVAKALAADDGSSSEE